MGNIDVLDEDTSKSKIDRVVENDQGKTKVLKVKPRLKGTKQLDCLPSRLNENMEVDFMLGKMDMGRSFMKDGWFYDVWSGQAYCYKIEEVLFHQHTKFQEVLIFKSKNSGRILVLDGDVQCAEKDEFGYQEMIAHVPLACHPNPKNVLIVGGGDGGVIREVSKHPEVEKITLCEIDEDVIKACKEFMPSMAIGFHSPKLTVHIGDGYEFVKQFDQTFDVIINDLPDRSPVNDLTEGIYSKSYYKLLKDALKPDGLFIQQEYSVWNGLDTVTSVMEACGEHFSVVDYNMCMIPSFPDMQGFVLCSLDPNTNFRKPLRDLVGFDLKYYNSVMHRASFAIPEFATKRLQKCYRL